MAGGNYNFNYCTLTNYWANGFRSFPTLLVSDQIIAGDQQVIGDLTTANFTNCIIYGNENLELTLENNLAPTFNYNFSNCLIKFNDFNDQFSNNELYDFNNLLNTNRYSGIILDENPVFRNTGLHPFQILENVSPADGAGIPNALTTDILGNTRDLINTDLGAYKAGPFD